jgi:prefoldin subunit 5
MNIFGKLLKQTCWKIKARRRNIEIRKLTKRLKELETSRDKWKIKATERKNKIEDLEKQNHAIEQELKKN